MNKRVYTVGSSTLTLEFGDLTTSSAEVLVSSDDAYITMGGGVSAAILRAGGESILIDAAKRVPAKLGQVIVTAAGVLRARHIFHAITIGDRAGSPPDVVAAATRRCFELLESLQLSSIAFPAIGAGVAGFAHEAVAEQMAKVIVECLARTSRRIEVTLYLFDRFGRMQPMDFVRFFEEVAVHTHGLVATNTDSPRRRTKPKAAMKRRPRTKKERRTELVQQLGRLERERQELEAQLAAGDGSLDKAATLRIGTRLKQLHDERVQVLSVVNVRPHAPPASVFVSYSHTDERLRKKLGKHLSVLEHQGLIATWHDRMISAGTEWRGQIDAQLEKSRVILLLLSADFVGSKYCFDIEMKRALERHARQEALVIPVLLRPVVVHGLPFEKLQALPRDAKAATDWPKLDSAFVDITEGLRQALEGFVAPPTRRRSVRGKSRSQH